MAIKIDRLNGQNYADNILDPLLLFDDGTWTTASGTGSATLDSLNPFAGNKSLKLENTVPASTYTATNSVQSTVINSTGNYVLSFFIRKNFALEERSGSVLVYKNAVLLDTQTFTIGSAIAKNDINNVWQRYQSSTDYSFIDGDIVTFQFRINTSATAELTTFFYVDGVMLNAKGRGNAVVPAYNKPTINGLYNIYTGWADYVDTTYTTGSPFTVVDGAAAVDLPNNAGGGVTSQTPIDIDTFYDGTVITGRNGDGINLTFEFKCRPNGVGADPRLTVSIDIGGAVGEIYVRDFFLNKGNGVIHNFLSSYSAYTLGTWEANGGTVKVTAINEDIEIYDIRYVITRTHKAR